MNRVPAERVMPACGQVIVISGTSGAGKTSLVRKTAEQLGAAACLHFDDYQSSSTYPDLAAWLAAGADPNEWRTPEFAAAVQALRQGQAVALPDGKGMVEPQPYLVVEDPFGRARREMAPSVDFVVYLDLPLDIAMLRKLRRDAARYTGEVATPDVLRWLNDFCEAYLEGPLRGVYRVAMEQARAGADLVVDGMRPLDDLAREIARQARSL
jgi:uridine kinase